MTQIWVAPIELVDNMHLREDSRVLFFKEPQSGGYEVFDSYAIKGGSPFTHRVMLKITGKYDMVIF